MKPMITLWDKVISDCPLSFDLITRNADQYTKKNYPKNEWIYDANVPTSLKYLPEFFKANDVELKQPLTTENILYAFVELEIAIRKYKRLD